MSIFTGKDSVDYLWPSACPQCGGTFAHKETCSAGYGARTTPATFERLADATLARCRAVYAQRGASYGDTWLKTPFNALDAVTRKLGYVVERRHMRAIAAAVLVDIKYERLVGGYSDDSIVDGINYAAVLAEEMRELSKKGT